MEPTNPYSLEEFAERHRADFDLHEPRPELWNVLEARLEADGAGKASLPRMGVLPEPTPAAGPRPLAPSLAAQPVLRTQRRRWQYAGVALALAALVVAAGLGEFWKAHHPAAITARLKASEVRRTGSDAALYLRADADVVAASQGGPNGNARLDTAVHGMERYYVTQLQERQAQLAQLAPDNEAEWTQDLVGLDSVYQQLKRELPRHPQPEVVLTAMNRNLQIRLDILDRQLELRGADQLAQSPSTIGSEYALADSRSVAENAPHHHAR